VARGKKNKKKEWVSFCWEISGSSGKGPGGRQERRREQDGSAVAGKKWDTEGEESRGPEDDG